MGSLLLAICLCLSTSTPLFHSSPPHPCQSLSHPHHHLPLPSPPFPLPLPLLPLFSFLTLSLTLFPPSLWCRSDNWPLMLKLHLKWRCEHLKERWNPLAGDKQYPDLDTYSRICIMHKLCHWRLELDDIADLLRVSHTHLSITQC